MMGDLLAVPALARICLDAAGYGIVLQRLVGPNKI
jgi:hypothetical protein